MKVILRKKKNYHPLRLNLRIGDVADIPDKTAKRWIKEGIAYLTKEESLRVCRDRVSIVILIKDALKYFKLCLESLIRYTCNYELIIVDNGSGSLTKKYLSDMQSKYGFTLITNSKNMGFAYGCNQGIKASTCDYICFLNSDTVVTENWLPKLMEGFKYPDAGIVGPSTCWANGDQMIKELMSRHDNMTLDDINSIRLEPAVIETELIGFCYLVAKKVIDKIGVFDYRRYGLGLSEEKDYNWRAKKAGFRLYWIKNSYVHHWGGKTWHETGINPHKLLAKNRNILKDRIENDENIFIENDSIVEDIILGNKKTCVIIPVLNRKEETAKTLKSLFENNSDINVLIVDNGSKDVDYLNEFKVKIIKNKTNLGSVKAINQGLDLCNSKYIVIMHNDIMVNIFDWINKGIKFMDENPDVGVVGIAGWKNIEIIGYPVWSSIITAIDRYNEDKRYPESPPKGDFGEVAVLDGCCNIIRNIGIRLDNIYGYHHFYDIDMSMQYRKAGYNLFVMGGSATHFAENGKSSTSFDPDYLGKIKMKDIQYYEINRKKFKDKWKNYLPIKIQFQ